MPSLTGEDEGAEHLHPVPVARVPVGDLVLRQGLRETRDVCIGQGAEEVLGEEEDTGKLVLAVGSSEARQCDVHRSF